MLQQAILLLYHQTLQPRWLTRQGSFLGRNCLQASIRQLSHQAKRTDHWKSYKIALTCYNKEIKKEKQSSWRDYCWGIKDAPDRAGLLRIVASQKTRWDLLNYLMANEHNLEKRPGWNHTEFFFQGLLQKKLPSKDAGSQTWGHLPLKGRTGNCL